MNSGLSNWIDVPAQRGYDILTTIDIDIQDIVEEELLTMCDSVNAEWGTAIIMEVATGEIKAISNVEFDEKTGQYVEAMNRAVQAFEPGSVMKPISLMMAFEDGIVHSVNDQVDCRPFQGTADHAGGGMKTMKQVIETSSNPGYRACDIPQIQPTARKVSRTPGINGIFRTDAFRHRRRNHATCAETIACRPCDGQQTLHGGTPSRPGTPGLRI